MKGNNIQHLKYYYGTQKSPVNNTGLGGSRYQKVKRYPLIFSLL